jgi:hypothetical protein
VQLVIELALDMRAPEQVAHEAAKASDKLHGLPPRSLPMPA